MVYEVFSSPADTASLFRSFHRAAPSERAALIRDAPLPRGASVALKVEKSSIFDQDRLNLGQRDAARTDRIWGMVVHINPASGSANTWTPACAQVMFRFCWFDDFDRCKRSIFLRTSAYTASFAPRVVSDQPRNLRRGDLVSGLLHRGFLES